MICISGRETPADDEPMTSAANVGDNDDDDGDDDADLAEAIRLSQLDSMTEEEDRRRRENEELEQVTPLWNNSVTSP